ncbi:hypothetical protein [Pseudomonas sp. NFACC02]|uniref:hypothetical protein n=1 Tax=Pseudomonas sp. NFACC02 TaxID=1566250 RepID=UPI0011142CB5|nr:hypothetical protein [Pseudomonas sp. NFACC02]
MFNQNNIIQIDADYSNLRLITKVTVSPNVVDTATWCFQRRVDVQLPGTMPFVAYTCTSNTWVSVYVSNGVRYARVENDDGAAVTLYVFDQSPPPSAGFGFEVFNAQGVIVFSAAARYCKVLGQTVVNNNSPGGTFSYSGKTVAVVANNNARTVSAGPSGDVSKWDAVYWNSYCRNSNGSTIVIEYFPTRTLTMLPGPPPNAGLNTSGNYLLVDVTGM